MANKQLDRIEKKLDFIADVIFIYSSKDSGEYAQWQQRYDRMTHIRDIDVE